jgi:hypothetical protein
LEEARGAGDSAAADFAADASGDEAAGSEPVEAIIRGAVRAEFDEVIPHVVTALKRHDAVSELAARLDRAEKQLAERGQRPIVASVRRVLIMTRRLDFDAEYKDAIVAELERVLVGAGYTEFGEVGEPFDPARHEPLAGEARHGPAVVQEVFEPGLEALGLVVAPARVRVGSAGDESQLQEESE